MIANPDIDRVLAEYDGPDFRFAFWERDDPEQVIEHLTRYYSWNDATDGPCIMEAALGSINERYQRFETSLAKHGLLEGISESLAGECIQAIVTANDDGYLALAADMLYEFLAEHVHLAPVVEIPPCEPARQCLGPLLQDARHAARAQRLLPAMPIREEVSAT